MTGRLPFEAETPLAAASRRMVADPPPLTAYRPDTPTPLEEVIAVALRREPEARYETLADFAQALRWSRERSPALAMTAVGERGGWVLGPRPPLPAAPPPDLVPVDAGSEPPASDPELQTTVLRVAPLTPPEESELPSSDETPAG